MILKNMSGNENFSSFYWNTKGSETEGIKLITSDESKIQHYQNNKEFSSGILVIANNPVFREYSKKKIMILSGFTGVSTYGIAKLITDKKFKHQLDLLYADYVSGKNENVEIVIGIKYKTEEFPSEKGDNRDLQEGADAVSYDDMIKI